MERTLIIQPRDPAIFRDGKPFTLGLPARSTPWPTPSAVIGAIRTRLGRLTRYDKDTVARLKLIEHCGPFLASPQGDAYTLAFPAPADVVAFAAKKGELELCAVRPEKLRDGEGTDLEDMPPLLGGRDTKPVELPPFWTAAATMAWLEKRGDQPVFRQKADAGLGVRARQKRIHVKIEAATQAAEKSMLFATEGLEFSDHERVWEEKENDWKFTEPRPRICSRIRYGDSEEWAALERLAPIGGERRLAYWREEKIDWPAAPERLANEKLVRLQLATPGCFEEGWKPGWLAHGRPPGTEGLEVTLVAAAVPRAVPLSGWDLTKPGKNSQKATRFLAPAGSVYFCEVKGDPRQLWLKSISDDEQDRRDGFGLVLCGVWQWR